MITTLFDRLLGKQRAPTAQIAKERLSVIIARERIGSLAHSDILERMQEEVLAVVSKYFPVPKEAIQVQVERKDNMEILEVDIVLPENKPVSSS